MVGPPDQMQINQYQYQINSGQNTFRGTGEDWNALSSGAQVKQSVDSIAVSVSGGTGARNAAQMHQTFRKGRYR